MPTVMRGVPDYFDEEALARLVAKDSHPEGDTDGDAGCDAGHTRETHDGGSQEPTERAVESAEERRQRLQDRIDALLDRINEVGGMAGLAPEERRELAETSDLLRRETAES